MFLSEREITHACFFENTESLFHIWGFSPLYMYRQTRLSFDVVRRLVVQLSSFELFVSATDQFCVIGKYSNNDKLYLHSTFQNRVTKCLADLNETQSKWNKPKALETQHSKHRMSSSKKGMNFNPLWYCVAGDEPIFWPVTSTQCVPLKDAIP